MMITQNYQQHAHNWKYLQRLPKKFRDKFAPVGTKVEKIEKWNNTENWNIPNYS